MLYVALLINCTMFTLMPHRITTTTTTTVCTTTTNNNNEFWFT